MVFDSQAPAGRVHVSVTIDTEEDNWGIVAENSATAENIRLLPLIQDVLDNHGARATYLVNRAPLMSAAGVEVLGSLSENPGVEIGGHCHPWNTPPFRAEWPSSSMMSALPREANALKVREVTARIRSELGVKPTSFRAGRWAFGETVAPVLFEEGYRLDSSVTPFMDWSPAGGPDYSGSPDQPYLFRVGDPALPDSTGKMIEIPATIGYLGPAARSRRLLRFVTGRSGRARRIRENLGRLRAISRRWLSPEKASANDMISLTEQLVARGHTILTVTLHSCTLLPGATPYVRTEAGRNELLARLDAFLIHCRMNGYRFATLREVGGQVSKGTAANA